MFPLVLLLGLLRRRCRCRLSLALLGVPGVGRSLEKPGGLILSLSRGEAVVSFNG